MASSRGFFKEKHSWSKLKDMLLANYLPPYLEKIKQLGNRIEIFDCFAGKGKYEDGEVGSPLIILEKVNKSNARAIVKMHFIEIKHGDELEANLKTQPYDYVNARIIKESFEKNVPYIRENCFGKNVFLYIDPYGHKSLNYSNFISFKKSRARTLEMLMNFNTFGFIREGCRILKVNNIESCFDEDETVESDEGNSIEEMNAIANGDYWQKIIKDCSKSGSYKIAESLFAEQYKKELEKVFKYVVNVPIKEKASHIPKYRMYFGTDSDDGLILMADQMNKAWNEILKLDTKFQGDLFSQSGEFSIGCTLEVFEKRDVAKELIEFLNINNRTNAKAYYVDLIRRTGITYSPSTFREILHDLEDKKNIVIHRKEEITKTGKKSTAINFEKKEIFLERKSNGND